MAETQAQSPPGRKLIGQNLIYDSAYISSLESTPSSASVKSESTSTSSSSRYSHSTSTYHLSNDAAEHARLDLQQHLWRLSLGGLCCAPLDADTVEYALDCGTGSGLWPWEFASEHPKAKVLGMDLSPIERGETDVKNCSFVVGDVNEDWDSWTPAVYGTSRTADSPLPKFDYIHSRLILMGVSSWPAYVEKAFANLKPGGWVELIEVRYPMYTKNPQLMHLNDVQDTNLTPHSDLPPVVHWSWVLGIASGKAGRDFLIPLNLAQYLSAAGFVNVREYQVEHLIGPWAVGEREKELGRLYERNMRELVDSVGTRLFTVFLGWDESEADKFLEDVRKDLEDVSRGYYWLMSVFVAQKPADASG